MNSIELVSKLEFGDRYRSPSLLKDEDVWLVYDSVNPFSFSRREVLADDWEIKKKEEEPITAEEFYNNIDCGIDNKKAIYTRITEAFKAGEKNNGLKLRKAIEYLKKIANQDQHNFSDQAEAVIANKLINLIK